MPDLREVTQSIDIPANTGIEGFLHAIKEIIRQSRVQKVVLDASGRISYTRLVSSEASDENLGISFEHIEPYAIIRNTNTRELTYPPSLGASDVLTSMFDALATEGFSPICFAVSTETTLWTWLYFTSGIELQNHDMLFGYAVYQDRQLPNTALVLCAGIGYTRALIDTRLAVKIEMNQNRILNEEMEII